MIVLVGHKRLRLVDLLGAGATADIYRHPEDKRKAVKIYKPGEACEELRLKFLQANPPSQMWERGDALYGWPIEIAYDAATGELRGYEMWAIRRATPLQAIVNPNARLASITRRWLWGVAISFLTRIHTLHLRDFIVGDINFNNFMVNRHGIVSQVDIDSVHFTMPNGPTFTNILNRAELQPPELIGACHPILDRDQDQDAYSAAMVVHRLLRDGIHAFDCQYCGSGNPLPLHEMIRLGIWPDSLRHAEYRPKSGPTPFASLPAELQRLFRRMFEDGHDDRNARPNVTEFLSCLIQNRPFFRSRPIGRFAWRRELRPARWRGLAPRHVAAALGNHRGKLAVMGGAALGFAILLPRMGVRHHTTSLATGIVAPPSAPSPKLPQSEHVAPPPAVRARPNILQPTPLRPQPRLWQEALRSTR